MTVYGLIGYPLDHSFSAKYFSEKFEREQIKDVIYKLFPLPDLKDLPSVLAITDLQGLNVTIPYKKTIIEWLDEIDEKASQTGAVNTIKIRQNENGKKILKGFNTDVDGFLESADFSAHKKALILGTGGGSLAVQCALKSLGIEFLTVSRTKKPFESLLYSDLTKEILTDHTLIINATPSGMFPDTEVCPPIPYQYLGPAHLLYDLVYNPEETLFLRKGKLQNAATMNGLKMLRLQAGKSYDIWTNQHI